MSWQLAISFSLIFSTAFSLLQRQFAQLYPGKATISTALMYIFVVSPLGIGGALIIGDISFDFSALSWVFLIVAGLLFALANIAAFDANTHVDAGQFSIIGNLRALTTILASSIILSETLNFQQWIGALLLISSVVVIATTRFNRQTRSLDRHSLIAVASAVLFGLAITNEKWLLDQMTFSTYLVIGWGFQTVAMMAIALFRTDGLLSTRLDMKYFRWLVGMGVLRTLAGFALIYSLIESDNSSLIASIVSYKTAMVVVAAFVVLKEHDHKYQKFAGATLGTIGLLLSV